MLVGDLIYNNEFDCNCNYDIYDCTEKGATWDMPGTTLLVSTKRDGFHKPLDSILDMKIKYITTDYHTIVIEAARN